MTTPSTSLESTRPRDPKLFKMSIVQLIDLAESDPDGVGFELTHRRPRGKVAKLAEALGVVAGSNRRASL